MSELDHGNLSVAVLLTDDELFRVVAKDGRTGEVVAEGLVDPHLGLDAVKEEVASCLRRAIEIMREEPS